MKNEKIKFHPQIQNYNVIINNVNKNNIMSLDKILLANMNHVFKVVLIVHFILYTSILYITVETSICPH